MQNHYIKDQCFLWNMLFLVGVECLVNCITKNGFMEIGIYKEKEVDHKDIYRMKAWT